MRVNVPYDVVSGSQILQNRWKVEFFQEENVFFTCDLIFAVSNLLKVLKRIGNDLINITK